MTKNINVDRAKYASGYYDNMLEIAKEFQDFVVRKLYPRGLILINYISRDYQFKEGENILGAEIKLDNEFRNTGNLYIEVAEKSNPDNMIYVKSGIYRADNSWLFIIGDKKTLYIFSTKLLRNLDACNNKTASLYIHTTTSTSKGYLLPLIDAEKYCALKIDLDNDNKMIEPALVAKQPKLF